MSSRKRDERRGGIVLELRFGLLFDEGIQPIRVRGKLVGGSRRLAARVKA